MFISVVIPLFNKEHSIVKAIDSVLLQKYVHFELIIIDDGSTDSSLDRISHYTDPRVQIISQKNQGVSAARNNGVALAKANYVAFLDADDCYHEDFLSRIVSLINISPEAALFCCRFQLVNEVGELFVPAGTLAPGFKGELSCFFATFRDNRSLIHPSCMAVNKQHFWAVGGFAAGKAVGEDLQLILQLALQGKVVADYTVAATVFRNAENRTAHRAPAQISCHIQYFLGNDNWQQIAEDKARIALLDFMQHNTLVHIAGAALNGKRTLARYYAKLLWPFNKSYCLLGFMLSILPTAVLARLKRQRNHG